MHPVSKGRGACRGTRRGSKRSAWAPGRTAPRGPVPPTRASPTPAVTRRPRLRISAHRPRSGRGTRDRLAAVVLHAMDRAVPVRDDGAGAGLALPGHVDGGQEDGVGLRELVESGNNVVPVGIQHLVEKPRPDFEPRHVTDVRGLAPAVLSASPPRTKRRRARRPPPGGRERGHRRLARWVSYPDVL